MNVVIINAWYFTFTQIVILSSLQGMLFLTWPVCGLPFSCIVYFPPGLMLHDPVSLRAGSPLLTSSSEKDLACSYNSHPSGTKCA